MNSTPKITGIRLIDQAPFPDRSQLIAFFSVEYAGIALHECMLIQRASGALISKPPRVNDERNGPRLVSWADPNIADAMTAAAHAKYLMLRDA